MRQVYSPSFVERDGEIDVLMYGGMYCADDAFLPPAIHASSSMGVSDGLRIVSTTRTYDFPSDVSTL